jgi:hypothetical protein
MARPRWTEQAIFFTPTHCEDAAVDPPDKQQGGNEMWSCVTYVYMRLHVHATHLVSAQQTDPTELYSLHHQKLRCDT